MNTFCDLLTRYAADSGVTVDAREWLMLLELDPTRAATVMTHLAVLAAEDHAIQLAAEALDVLRAAASRPEATTTDTHDAAAQIAAFTERMSIARQRAWQCWTDTIVPLLHAAAIIRSTACRAQVVARPRTWAVGWLTLPGHAGAYPAQIARRRRVNGRPVVRLDAETCRRLPKDLTGSERPTPPLVLIDRDRPIAVLGAANLEHAWQLDATLVHADADGWFTFGRTWPWHADAEQPRVEADR